MEDLYIDCAVCHAENIPVCYLYYVCPRCGSFYLNKRMYTQLTPKQLLEMQEQGTLTS